MNPLRNHDSLVDKLVEVLEDWVKEEMVIGEVETEVWIDDVERPHSHRVIDICLSVPQSPKQYAIEVKTGNGSSPQVAQTAREQMSDHQRAGFSSVLVAPEWELARRSVHLTLDQVARDLNAGVIVAKYDDGIHFAAGARLAENGLVTLSKYLQDRRCVREPSVPRGNR